MNRFVQSFVTGVMALAVILVGSTVQAQHSLGIHFVNGGTGGGGPGSTPSPTMDPSEMAGVVPQANWNNMPANFFAFNVGPLTDNNGVALAGASLSFQGNNTWTNGTPDAPGDARLMGSYLDSTNNSFTIVLIKGLSALTTGSYDVYVYGNGDGTNRHGFYTLNNGNLDTSGLGGTTLEMTEYFVFDPEVGYMQDMQDGNGGNYVIFPNQTGDAVFLLATGQNPNDPTDNGVRAPINAIQIVAH
jgi:hypothetical protein